MLGALSLFLAAAPFTVAAPGFRCAGIDAAVCDAYLEHFSTGLAREGRLVVRTRSDIAQLLGVERQKALLGCDEGSCLVELIGGLGVDAVLNGGVSRTDAGYIATLRLLRARDGGELASASSRFESSKEMEDWLDVQAEVIADKLAPPPPRPPVNKGRVALLAGGGVLLVTGAVLYALSKMDAAALKGNPPPADIDGIAARGRVIQPLGLALGITGAVALAGALLWLALDDSDAPAPSVAPIAGGAMVGLSWRLP